MSDDERIVLGPIPHDPGVLSLSRVRKQRDLEAEVELLRADNARLAKVISEHDSLIVAGKVTKHSQEMCKYHLHIVVDEHAPVVECSDCGTVLDAHQVLLQLATQERTFRSWTEHYIKERHELHAECEALRKLKARLRADCRKVDKKAPVERWQLKEQG